MAEESFQDEAKSVVRRTGSCEVVKYLANRKPSGRKWESLDLDTDRGRAAVGDVVMPHETQKGAVVM